MQAFVKRAAGCVAVFGLVVFVLAHLTDIVERKSSDYKYIPFFEHAEDMDVLFMGTSHVINAVFPMELWKDYGITSYNFGGHGNALPTTYWVIENALDYAKPKVVMVDCLGLANNCKTSTAYEQVHLSLDAFPLSVTKLKTANDLLNDAEYERQVEEGLIDGTGEKRVRLGLLWDFSVYHTRWNELTAADFEPTHTVEYGAESRIQIAEPNPVLHIARDEKLETETVGMDYLKKIIEDCQKRGIEVVLTYLPFPASEGEWQEANTVYDIAEEYQVKYINFLNMDLVNYDTDCFDPTSHLNPSGARKVTEYLGKLLRKDCGVADHRGDDRYQYWDDDYAAYEAFKMDNLGAQADLNTYLMLLADKNVGFVMKVQDGRIFEDSVTMNLLENLGVDVSQISEKTRYILSAGKKTLVINAEIFGGMQMDTPDGTVAAVYDGDNQYRMMLDGMTILQREQADLDALDDGVRISVFKVADTGTTVSRDVFAIPARADKNRVPNEYGVILQTSPAVRIE